MGPDPREFKNKAILVGRIEIGTLANVDHMHWAETTKAAKSLLACWNVDTPAIWDRFVAVNEVRGNAAVPAGFLLGFMRQWRTSAGASSTPIASAKTQQVLDPAEMELHRLIAAAPSKNREFHASDLRQLMGQAAYDRRILDAVLQFDCHKFTATLAVHGRAGLIGEVSR